MSLLYRTLLRPALFLQDSEKAHNRLILSLSVTSRSRLLMSFTGNLYGSPELPVNLFGLEFSNPIGIAAGLDKNGEAVPAWQSLGFGFSEIGGVTLHDQLGNPRPRMFRATAEKALVNRMGFNNMGAELIHDKLSDWKERGLWPGSPVGINLGKSRITPLADAPEDYAGSMRILWNHADFFVINVSSPNTLGLRELQQSRYLDSILGLCQKTNSECSEKSGKGLKPLLVKDGIPSMGKVVIGTVRGDLHDIGKNLVGIMLKGAGFDVIDLGKDVPPEKFVNTAAMEGAKIIGMSALLTTTMPVMKEVITILRNQNLTAKIKTIIGGAPLSKEYALKIGADVYAYDAANAVESVKQLIQE